MSTQQRICQNCQQRFDIDEGDQAFYAKIGVPAPTFCPECRLQRRFAWKNTRSLYRRTCDLCKEDKIGVYAADKPYIVYCTKCWWSDNWDAMDYGRDYDPSRSFFEQFQDLLKRVPLLNRFVYENTMVRSDYSNMANDLKDCYLVFHAEYGERCYYCEEIYQVHDCVDVSYVGASELCYDALDLQKCSRVAFSRNCESCLDSYFLKDCIDCQNCFGCVNLRHKQYYIFNKPYSKEEYFKKLSELGFNSGSFTSVQRFKQEARKFALQFPTKYIHARHNTEVSGDYIYNSKNVFHSFNVSGAQDSKFLSSLLTPPVRDSYDWTIYGGNGELMYEILQAGGDVASNKFGWCIWLGTREIEYGVLNMGSTNCFGCVGIKKKKYCILNKQYTKEEFEQLRAKVIEQMAAQPYTDKGGKTYRYGEFFPAQLSPFGYNETTAQEEFALKEEQAVAQGYNWIDKDKQRGQYEVTKNAADLPDNIADVTDGVLKEIIACANCARPYRIIEQELAFYRTQHLPLPHLCVECRYLSRIQMKNPFRLFARTCQCSGEAATSSSALSGSTEQFGPELTAEGLIEVSLPKGNSQQTTDNIYNNTAEHFHKDEHCPNTFKTSYSPDKQDIVYCEECYLAEVV